MMQGKDITEKIRNGLAPEGAIQRLEGAIPYEPEAPDSHSTLCLITASTVAPERVEWLWRYRIPRGKITVGDGDPGLGKSTVWLDLAARISTGRELPDGEQLRAPGSVILLSAEDGIADTIVPRLTAAGADLTRIHILDAIEEGTVKRPVCLPDDTALLRQAITQTEAVYVVIDPLVSFLSGKIDSHKDQQVRRVLYQLKDVAEETRAAIVMCRHMNKAGGTNALYRGGGSIGIIGAARVGLIFAPEPSKPGEERQSQRCIIAVAKSNVGKIPPALAYRMETDPVHDCGRIVWEGETSYTANELIAPPLLSQGENGALGEAMEFVRMELMNGGRTAKGMEAAATDAGISQSTLRRARKQLGIKPRKEGKPGEPGQWIWELPSGFTIEDDHDSPKMTIPTEMDIFGADEHLRDIRPEASADNHTSQTLETTDSINQLNRV